MTPQIGDRVTFARDHVPGSVWTIKDVFASVGLVLIVRPSGTFEISTVAGFDEIKQAKGKEAQ